MDAVPRWPLPSLLLPLGLAFTAPLSVAGETGSGGPFALCPLEPLPEPPRPTEPGLAPGTTEIHADRLEAGTGGGLYTLSGRVEATRDGQALRAGRARYHDLERWLEAEGDVQYWSDDLFWEGARAHFDLDTDIGVLQDGYYRVPEAHARGRAKEVERDRRADLTRLRGLSYTTCALSRETWRFDAARLKLDHGADRGTARDAVLRIADVPVLYLPYLSFPLSDARKTGFLWPTLGSSERSGLELAVPFYWNIAPERDATLTPRVYGQRGVMLGGQYRYLMPSGQGTLELEYMPSDRKRDDEQRSLLAFEHQQVFMDGRLATNLLFNGVSDKAYFEDFGSRIALSSQRFLERRAEARYRAQHWNALLRFQGFQVVDRNLTGLGPYQRLPQLLFNGQLPGGGNQRLNFGLNAEAVYFDRRDSVTGARLDLRPSVSLPYRTASGFLIPKLTTRYTRYFLDGEAAGTPDSPDRLLPYLSVDGGLFFDRPWQLGGGYTQTLEPRLYYLYVPYRDQSELPVFDTGQYDFSFDQLFREDRFSGPDRMGDANQITLALSSRLFEDRSGLERLRFSGGQIYYFENQRVTLPGQRVSNNRLSDTIAELTARPTEALRMRGTLMWKPEIGALERAVAGMRYQPDPYRVVNLDYRLRKDILGVGNTEIEQMEGSFRWPVNPRWSAVGRLAYSLRTGESVDAFAGMEYNNCCWGVRAVFRRFLATAGGEFETGFFVQLELKGLAGIGAATRTVLEQNIPGYQSEF